MRLESKVKVKNVFQCGIQCTCKLVSVDICDWSLSSSFNKLSYKMGQCRESTNFKICDQVHVSLQSVCSATETSWNIENLHVTILPIIFFRK